VSGSVIGGLALAFIAVVGAYLWRPELVTSLAGFDSATSSEAPASPEVDSPTSTEVALEPSVVPPVSKEAAASYAAAVRIAAPAVVNLYVTRVATEPVLRSFLDDPFGEFAPRYRRRVEQSLGSGVILDPSGQIITNHHVIEDAAAIRVQLADGRSAQAEIVGRDPDTDLAVLKIDLSDLPSIRLGRSDALSVGDVVLAIGNPIGLAQTVTQGIVSVIAKSLGVEGIGFAIPVNLVRGVVNEIITRGKVLRGWIGVGTETIDEARARDAGFDGPVVRITRIAGGSPAQRAGLLPGDFIIGLDSKTPRSSREVQLRIADTSPGQTITVGVQRGNQRGETKIRVEEAPQKLRPR